MRILLLVLALIIVGCSPLSRHNMRMDQLTVTAQQIRDDSMSSTEKNKALIAAFRTAFPEYEMEVDYIEGLHQKITQKKTDGLDATDDIKEANEAINQFLAFTRERALSEEQAYIQGLGALSDSMSRTGQQIQNNSQTIYGNSNGYQPRRPINCTTSMGYLGTTAFTSCY
ncbi:MAG TPA: hypothetical protein DDW94_09670 [Deltaproteobacteria bacterium]|nr:MAG: hypothetical protein A2Z79_12270 [Deltaproteobacteria bacterium GWA2_55_82]OGQ63947.1 MAG: hypothetical protein A3I81_07800 [Deltaproteobacteria bacterium RIFCSPLOWO2_02_FULL_55_12]OIJ73379.1 MAG: hypothetical protein A2V21_303340 [Deltaproteobacteria bacterium GWC2_55_46]HBG47239.1 hypothetical protein [Deltaproteobacteria bacterium]HCY10005.1 hypothetical protein [Deltaproteobacteria bacterium]